jgi:ketosteroid isomerase-like protein
MCVRRSIDRCTLPGLLSVTLMQGASINYSISRNGRTILVLLLVQVLGMAAFAGPQRPGMPRAQKHEVHREIDQKENAWRDAILKGNIATLDALLADDYMSISAYGTLQNKEQALANVRNGQLHFTALEFSDRKVHFYGTTALVSSRAEVTGTAGDKDISGSYRYIRVYVRDAHGEWKIVSFETSRISESGEPK